jgi:hypothetical protein
MRGLLAAAPHPIDRRRNHQRLRRLLCLEGSSEQGTVTPWWWGLLVLARYRGGELGWPVFLLQMQCACCCSHLVRCRPPLMQLCQVFGLCPLIFQPPAALPACPIAVYVQRGPTRDRAGCCPAPSAPPFLPSCWCLCIGQLAMRLMPPTPPASQVNRGLCPH